MITAAIVVPTLMVIGIVAAVWLLRWSINGMADVEIPPRFIRGGDNRFRTRMREDMYEVYSPDMEVWAECYTSHRATIIAKALERYYDHIEHPEECD